MLIDSMQCRLRAVNRTCGDNANSMFGQFHYHVISLDEMVRIGNMRFFHLGNFLRIDKDFYLQLGCVF